MPDTPPYEYVFKDFVDRVEQIKYLHQVVKTFDQRVILVQGLVGSGKTQLLEEFCAETPDANVAGVYIDLSRREVEPGFLDICQKIVEQLSAHDFHEYLEEFNKIFHPQFIGQVTILPPPSTGDSAGRGASGIDVKGNLVAPGSNIAGGDQYIFQNMLPNLDPLENEWIAGRLTIAALQGLSRVAAGSEVAILLDHWEAANRETRKWIIDHLLVWTLKRQLPRAILVIASVDRPEWYRARRDIGDVTLGELPLEAVLYYWKEICELPLEAMNGSPENFRFPQNLVLEARRAAPHNQAAGSGG